MVLLNQRKLRETFLLTDSVVCCLEFPFAGRNIEISFLNINSPVTKSISDNYICVDNVCVVR